MPMLSKIISEISNANKDIDACKKWIFAQDVNNVVETYSDATSYPEPLTNKFVRESKIICAFGIDHDESDTYILVEE